MLSNGEVSRMFGLYAELLLLHEKDEKLAFLLSGAAYRIRRMEENVLQMDRSKLAKLFRTPVSKIIGILSGKQSLPELEELIQLTPQGLFEMMRIKGLGGKKLAILWKKEKIDSIDRLLEACTKHKVSGIPGFGAKTESNIIAAIENYRGSQDQFHLASVKDQADALLSLLRKELKSKLVDLCGEVRREATTVKGIEMIAAIPSKKLSSPGIKKFLIVTRADKKITSGHTLDEIPVTIYHCEEKDFFKELFLRTGSDKHIEKIIGTAAKMGDVSSEEMIYKKAGLPFIPPEMRDLPELDKTVDVSKLLTLKDIRGVVHNHTTWSDGVDRLESFVSACTKKGFEYVVISDHSKNAHYAGGLKEDKVLQQIQEIDQLNQSGKYCRIFKSIECDILVSGELDYEPALLSQFDLVIVSIHQLLKMDEEKATKRLIRAIENPYTTILGHMTGRQLLIRPGYPVNFRKIIDACAANKVVIEINANPYRLDMDWSHIPYAMKKKVMISINPDAHSISEIDNIRWGVSAARKGGLTKEMTWNAMPLRGIEKWIEQKNGVLKKKPVSKKIVAGSQIKSRKKLAH